MTFSEEFTKSRGEPFVYDGQRIVQMIKQSVQPGSRVSVTLRNAIATPVQGIRLKLQGGSLRLGQNELKDVVLWRDTAPDESVFVCCAKKESELRVWNCWRDNRGVTQAWVGNAAIRTEQVTPARVRAACNSRPEVTFADLVFDLEVQIS